MQALRTLLWHIVDYAGLFPPATLPMEAAVRNYATYRTSEHCWMLGRFVVPVARLAEFEVAAESCLSIRSDVEPWRLSALAGASLDTDLEAITAFNLRHAHEAVIDTLELKASTIEEINQIAQRIPDQLMAYIEIPINDDPSELIAALARTGMRAKVRTGGTTPDMFPQPHDLLRFMEACIVEDIAFKATAGLHHPLRGDYRLTYEAGSATVPMYGFLNVFIAAAFLDAGMSTEDVLPILLETAPDAFYFNDEVVDWRGNWMTTEPLADTRKRRAIAFGSCSFEEPLADLKVMNLL